MNAECTRLHDETVTAGMTVGLPSKHASYI